VLQVRKVTLVRETELYGNSSCAPRPLFAASVVLAAFVSAACGSVAPPPTGENPGAGAGGTGSTGSGGTSATGGSKSGSGGSKSGSGGTSSGTGGTTTGSGGTGSGGTGNNTGSGGTSGMPPIGGELSDCDTPGPRLIRRLTSTQFHNTLVDAFQDPNVPTADVLVDPPHLRFKIDADKPSVRDLDASLLIDYAETVAEWATTNKLNSFNSCTDNNEGCWRPFIQNVGLKLFREPLTEEQVSNYLDLFRAETTFKDGAAVVIMTMVQSPYLLYRRELGTPEGGGFKLTPHEVASQLSYFLTDSAPDAQLLDAAANGRLGSAEDLDREANRLVATPAGRAVISRFLESWFEIEGLHGKAKDANTFNLTPELRTSMLGESREFFLDAFFNGGDVKSLFTSTHTFVDQALASFYGLPGGGGGFQRVELGSSNRARGLLGHGAFLTHHAQPENSSPVQRGRFVRDRILCEKIPEMPEDLDTNLESGANYTTNRERYAEHSRNPVCAGCHVSFDPVGFTFEHFDGFGRYRDQEKGAPIDASGGITHVDGTGTEIETPLDGVESLTDYLADNDRVRACVVRYWSYYAYGRDNWQEKKCNDDSVRREAGENGYTLKSIVMGILHAPTFTRRVQDQ
jgi:hypothetical protein